MPVKSATLTAISDDTGTPGDFKTTDTTLSFSGTYTFKGNGNLFVFVDGKNVGQATLNESNLTWSLPYNSATESPLGVGTHTIALGTSANANSILSGSAKTIEVDASCFMAGTLIRTATGNCPIEMLSRGDVVITTDAREMPIAWIGKQKVSMTFADKNRVTPIRIRAGALGENVPSRDLLVSPCHAILVDGNLIQAGALVNGSSVTRLADVPGVFTYYHIELDDHSLIFAENAPAETFVDNVDRLAFDNWAEHEALFPNGKEVPELPYPRAKSHRQVPRRTREMLAARAAAIVEAPISSVA
jgi:Hint domain